MESEESPSLFACERCGTVAMGESGVMCCDRRMGPVDAGPPIAEPSLADLLRNVFDMGETELEVCLCVMEGGDTTVSELAEAIGFDRSVVSRHLNHLAEVGVVEKRRQLLERGGHTYSYSPVPPETVRSALRDEFLAWLRTALSELDALEREKIESIAETDAENAWRIYRRSDDA